MARALRKPAIDSRVENGRLVVKDGTGREVTLIGAFYPRPLLELIVHSDDPEATESRVMTAWRAFRDGMVTGNKIAERKLNRLLEGDATVLLEHIQS